MRLNIYAIYARWNFDTPEYSYFRELVDGNKKQLLRLCYTHEEAEKVVKEFEKKFIKGHKIIDFFDVACLSRSISFSYNFRRKMFKCFDAYLRLQEELFTGKKVDHLKYAKLRRKYLTRNSACWKAFLIEYDTKKPYYIRMIEMPENELLVILEKNDRNCKEVRKIDL